MRKLAAILLWGIVLFNWVGYRLLNDYLQEASQRKIEVRLDQRLYDESQLFSIKVPVTHISYYNNSTVFERVNGQIEINGMPYQYVQRRIYNDTLELRCIPNQTALRLRLSMDEYFRTVADIQHPQGKQHPASFKTFSGDPFTLAERLWVKGPGFIEIPRTDHLVDFYSSVTGCTHERPPNGLV